MNDTKRTVNEDTLEKLLYLSRLSPESTDMVTLKKQVDEIVGYFDILSKYDDSENPYDAYPTTTAENRVSASRCNPACWLESQNRQPCYTPSF